MNRFFLLKRFQVFLGIGSLYGPSQSGSGALASQMGRCPTRCLKRHQRLKAGFGSVFISFEGSIPIFSWGWIRIRVVRNRILSLFRWEADLQGVQVRNHRLGGQQETRFEG